MKYFHEFSLIHCLKNRRSAIYIRKPSIPLVYKLATMWEIWEILQVLYANYSKTLMSTAPALVLSVVLAAICIWLWNALLVKKIDKKKRKMCFEFNDSELI